LYAEESGLALIPSQVNRCKIALRCCAASNERSTAELTAGITTIIVNGSTHERRSVEGGKVNVLDIDLAWSKAGEPRPELSYEAGDLLDERGAAAAIEGAYMVVNAVSLYAELGPIVRFAPDSSLKLGRRPRSDGGLCALAAARRGTAADAMLDQGSGLAD
jgi:hypothetical protein